MNAPHMAPGGSVGGPPQITAESRWQQLQASRSPYMSRAEACADLTIPTLVPRDGDNGSTEFVTPHQSMGARGVNNLASKLLLALLPPNTPFFRLTMGEFIESQLAGTPDLKAQIEATLGKIERDVTGYIEAGRSRVTVFEGLRNLITTGNTCIYVDPKIGPRNFPLRSYVVKRDPGGDVLEGVVLENISEAELTPGAKLVVTDVGQGNKGPSVENKFKLYTWIKLIGDKYFVHQEIKGKIIPGTSGAYPKDQSPWLFLRWTKLDGEDYGRGHVEEYYGDLRSLEGLCKAILEGSAAAAKVLILVSPNSETREEDVANAENLAVITGKSEDVTVTQLQKSADFTVAANQITRLEQRLSQAFLLVSSVQRQAERVTAEEIRLLAGELEDSLGGIYALLAQEFQLPFVRRLIYQMQAAGMIPPMPPQVTPSIVTGMEALGRGHDLQRLLTFASTVNQILGPGGFAQVAKPNAMILKIGTALGLDLDGLVKTDDEIAAEQQQQNQNNLMQRVGPEAVKAAAQQASPIGA